MSQAHHGLYGVCRGALHGAAPKLTGVCRYCPGDGIQSCLRRMGPIGSRLWRPLSSLLHSSLKWSKMTGKIRQLLSAPSNASLKIQLITLGGFDIASPDFCRRWQTSSDNDCAGVGRDNDRANSSPACADTCVCCLGRMEDKWLHCYKIPRALTHYTLYLAVLVSIFA
jgi:hypothetical protein